MARIAWECRSLEDGTRYVYAPQWNIGRFIPCEWRGDDGELLPVAYGGWAEMVEREPERWVRFLAHRQKLKPLGFTRGVSFVSEGDDEWRGTRLRPWMA